MKLFKKIAAAMRGLAKRDTSRGIKLSGSVPVDPAASPGERLRGARANTIIADDVQVVSPETQKILNDAFRPPVAAAGGPSRMGPGHPEWKGRAEIPLVVSGWALPGHPMFVYQQYLKYQNDANGLPDGWKVIGWTPEGVSYVVPESHWTADERKSPHPRVRKEHSPYVTPDEAYRDRLKNNIPAIMSDKEIDERVNAYRAYTTKLNEEVANILDGVRAGAERHARTILDNNDELYETLASGGRPADVEVRILAWVKECGQRAVDKRLDDTRRLLREASVLRAIPVDHGIYDAPADD